MSPLTMQTMVIRARIAQTRTELDHVKPNARVPKPQESPTVEWFIVTLAGVALAGVLFLNI